MAISEWTGSSLYGYITLNGQPYYSPLIAIHLVTFPPQYLNAAIFSSNCTYLIKFPPVGFNMPLQILWDGVVYDTKYVNIGPESDVQVDFNY